MQFQFFLYVLTFCQQTNRQMMMTQQQIELFFQPLMISFDLQSAPVKLTDLAVYIYNDMLARL